MAQLTIYIDDETRKRIERAAEQARSSVSQWVKSRLTEALERTWPDNYFELFGALRGSDLERPAQPPFDDDLPREPTA